MQSQELALNVRWTEEKNSPIWRVNNLPRALVLIKQGMKQIDKAALGQLIRGELPLFTPFQ